MLVKVGGCNMKSAPQIFCLVVAPSDSYQFSTVEIYSRGGTAVVALKFQHGEISTFQIVLYRRWPSIPRIENELPPSLKKQGWFEMKHYDHQGCAEKPHRVEFP